MKTAIIIPARYGSTRFPGKPLTKISGKTMLERVVSVGRKAAEDHDNVTLAVATEDQRIADHCSEIDVTCFMTSEDCPTGSDRVLEAAEQAGGDFDFVFSFQGDAPFTPPVVLTRMIEELEKQQTIEVITPVHRLNWDDLDRLRKQKKETPFSGTTVTRTNKSKALYFSKNIIPAIRNEAEHRKSGKKCPVLQHIGVYGYRMDILRKFVGFEQSEYEKAEGLEQLRLLENSISIFTVNVIFNDKEETFLKKLQGGIDAPEDVKRAESILEEYGEPF